MDSNDDDDDDYAVGYGKPPRQHRFKKGISGNPGGRPPKQQPANDLRSMLERVGNEEIEVAGQKFTMHEVELRALQRKAAKGDVAASRQLAKLRAEAGVGDKAPGGGVLLIPVCGTLDEWEAAAALQQAPYRERNYGTGNDPTDKESREPRQT